MWEMNRETYHAQMLICYMEMRDAYARKTLKLNVLVMHYLRSVCGTTRMNGV